MQESGEERNQNGGTHLLEKKMLANGFTDLIAERTGKRRLRYRHCRRTGSQTKL